MKWLIGSTLVIATLVGGVLFLNRHQDAEALQASDFVAGNIMSDNVMTNKDSMSVSQIQSFLNSKVPTCDTQGLQTSEFGGRDINGDGRVQRWEWAKDRGYDPPFTCLKDFSEGGKSSAQIIYDVSQEFSINPQVLIVLLQKEQALVTDTWPIPGSSQYRTATGYGCPDNEPCDSEYFGLTNQLEWSGRMFRAILNDSPTWFTPYELGTNFIQYNPSSSCGGSNVNIVNRTTQALYNYTPYQPNNAVLDWKFNGGSYPSSCGAYGNLNFFVYFSEWFGSTQGTPFFRINNGPTVYTLGEQDVYYSIDNLSKLEAYGWKRTVNQIANYTSNYTSSRTFAGVLSNLARFETTTVNLIDRGRVHAFGTLDDFNAYGYSFDRVSSLPATTRPYLVQGSQMRTITVDENGGKYYVTNGGKRYITSDTAYNSGEPRFSSLPGTGLSNAFLSTIRNDSPIWEPGLVVRIDTQPTIYIVQDPDSLMKVTSMDDFNDYRLDPKLVRNLSTQQLSLYTSDSNTSPIVKSADGLVYLVGLSGQKFPVDSTLLTPEFYNLPIEDITELNEVSLSRLTLGKSATDYIKPSNENTVYQVVNGGLVRVESSNQLFAQGKTFSDVITVSPSLKSLFL